MERNKEIIEEEQKIDQKQEANIEKEIFLEEEKETQEIQFKKYNQKEYLKIKAKRREIYKETKKIASNNFYVNQGNIIDLQIQKEPKENNFFIPKLENFLEKKLIKKIDIYKQIQKEQLIQVQNNSYNEIGLTKLYVINGDTLEVAKKFKDKGFKVAVLNMASDKNPGGGVESGAGAQEESLFRRSNYFQYLVENKNTFYPIPIQGGILSYDVKVFRKPEKYNYEFLDQPFSVDFIAVAALRNPPIKQNKSGPKYKNNSDQQAMEKKIETILSLGAYAGAQCLILGAFGCGAFHNSPQIISKLFQKIINEKFVNVFQCIVFAIIEDHNSSGNVKPFEQCFEVSSVKIENLVL